MQRKRVLSCPDGFTTATGSEPDEDLAHVLCQDGETGYCLSVSRFPHEDDLVEVMVYDQIVHRTADVTVELRPDQFRLTLSEQAAAQLDGTTEYVVPLSFECFEWGAFDVGRPHPLGHPVRPDGPWDHAVLSLRRTGEDIGNAWFLLDGSTLSVVVQVADKNGGRDDPWLIRLVADTLFGEEGFTAAYYDERATYIKYRNIKTNGVWEGSWAEMRGAPPGSAAGQGGK